jgi:lipopolysaccharide transport system ATP-binding protein
MSIAIQAENLAKVYRLGSIGSGSLATDLSRFWANLRGLEDPMLKVGEENDRGTVSGSEFVWSLRDINFEIAQGDAVGIIGRNGAGKSTLLKLLSRVTAPTVGSVRIKGRMASLLEVGTGFHPELTGRENIFLNGVILGMRKSDIKRQLDEIVEFSGVARYLDTPVKRYSSGMYVRLAFAVAAHLESEILVVDEVLAVGDAEFQKKCLGKMGEMSKSEGRTVLFVSHNIESISALCSKGIYLKNGLLAESGSIADVVNTYRKDISSNKDLSFRGSGLLKSASMENPAGGLITYMSPARLYVRFQANTEIKKVVLGVRVKDLANVSILSVNNRHYVEQGINTHSTLGGQVIVDFANLPLLPGLYTVDLFLGDTSHDIEVAENAFFFEVFPTKINPAGRQIPLHENKVFAKDVAWQFIEG